MCPLCSKFMAKSLWKNTFKWYLWVLGNPIVAISFVDINTEWKIIFTSEESFILNVSPRSLLMQNPKMVYLRLWELSVTARDVTYVDEDANRNAKKYVISPKKVPIAENTVKCTYSDYRCNKWQHLYYSQTLQIPLWFWQFLVLKVDWHYSTIPPFSCVLWLVRDSK